MPHIKEQRNDDGFYNRVFDVYAGNYNPGDAPKAAEEGVRISIRSPAKFGNVVVPDNKVIARVQKVGGWWHLFVRKDVKTPAENVFVGGSQHDGFITTWNPGEKIVSFALLNAEGFVGREVGAAVSSWPGRSDQRVPFGPQSNENGGEPSPWDPLNTNP